MQDAKETDPGAESFRIGRHLEQGVSYRAKQQSVECGRVLEEEWVELVGESEHNVEVGAG